MKKNFKDKLGVLVRIIVIFSIIAIIFKGEMLQYNDSKYEVTSYNNVIMFVAYGVGIIMIPCIMFIKNKFNNK